MYVRPLIVVLSIPGGAVGPQVFHLKFGETPVKYVPEFVLAFFRLQINQAGTQPSITLKPHKSCRFYDLPPYLAAGFTFQGNTLVINHVIMCYWKIGVWVN